MTRDEAAGVGCLWVGAAILIAAIVLTVMLYTGGYP